MMENYVYGRRNVIEFLKSGGKALKIILGKNLSGNTAKIIRNIADTQKIPVEIYDFKKITQIVSSTKHQGTVLFTQEPARPNFGSFIEKKPKEKIILVLDHILDPQNLGAILRSADWFGVKTVIIPKDRAAQITPAVAKISCGAVHNLKIFTETNLCSVIEKLKGENYWIAGTTPAGNIELSVFKPPEKICIILGSEDKGMSPLIEKQCDFRISIKKYGQIDSLNVSAAAAVVLFRLSEGTNK